LAEPVGTAFLPFSAARPTASPAGLPTAIVYNDNGIIHAIGRCVEIRLVGALEVFALMLTKETILDRLAAHGEQLRALGVARIELFGSYARDEQLSGSDIDFLVEFEDGRGGFRDFSGLQNLLEELFDSRIDLVKKSLVRKELRPYILQGERIAAHI